LVVGSKISLVPLLTFDFLPPTTSTRPSFKSVAVCSTRASVIESTAVKVCVVAFQTSAVESSPAFVPPTTKTSPLGRRTAAGSVLDAPVPASAHVFEPGV
jgi:hypothetical protein